MIVQQTRTKKNYFPLLWAFTPAVDLFGGLTPFPNQVTYLYAIFVLAFGLSQCSITGSFCRGYVKWLTLPLAYVIGFIVVSYYGVNFQNSIKFHVLYLPFMLVNYTIWYMIAYFFHESLSLKYLYSVTAIFGILSLVLGIINIIDADATRVISGLDLPIAISSSALFGNIFVTGILILTTIFSLKKTVVVCGVAAFLVAMIFKRGPSNTNVDSVPEIKRRKKKLSKGVLLLILIFSSGIIGFLFFPYLEATIARFFEGEDVIRGEIGLISVSLLFEYFPRGIGYYNFGYLTSDIIPYTTFTADGEQLDGVALHNTFMHFVLEGGLTIVVIVAIMFLVYTRIIFRLRKRVASRRLAGILISWASVAIIFGLFQQLHGTRYFFGIFAFCYGAFERYKRNDILLNRKTE